VKVVAEERVEDSLLASWSGDCDVLVAYQHWVCVAARAWYSSPVPVWQTEVDSSSLISSLCGAGESSSDGLNVCVKLLLVESKIWTMPREEQVRDVCAISTSVPGSTTGRRGTIPCCIRTTVNTTDFVVGKRIRLRDVLEILKSQEIEVEHVRELLLHSTQLHSDLNTITRDTGGSDGCCTLRCGRLFGVLIWPDAAESPAGETDWPTPSALEGRVVGGSSLCRSKSGSGQDSAGEYLLNLHDVMLEDLDEDVKKYESNLYRRGQVNSG